MNTNNITMITKGSAIVVMLILFIAHSLHAQQLKLKSRKANVITGSEFAKSIADSSLTLEQRENIIFTAIEQGNVPDFLRKLKEIKDTITIGTERIRINYYIIPDYLAIGRNDDFFYIPMTPILAQKVADLLKCSLPTKKIVDLIYKRATIKLTPSPIPPTKAMTTVPVFKMHNEMVKQQLTPYLIQHNQGELTAGHKKDIIISPKIYGEKTAKVVIYGWHQLNGIPIQPVYNKHSNTWADYSHGIRFIQNKIHVNGKKTSLQKVLADPILYQLLSDEGVIKEPHYPITNYE